MKSNFLLIFLTFICLNNFVFAKNSKNLKSSSYGETNILYEDFALVRFGKKVYFAKQIISILNNASIFKCAYPESLFFDKVNLTNSQVINFMSVNIDNVKSVIRKKESIRFMKVINHCSGQKIILSNNLVKSFFNSFKENKCQEKLGVKMTNEQIFKELIKPYLKAEIFFKSRFQTLEKTTTKKDLSSEWNDLFNSIDKIEVYSLLFF
jgi:hypothetical protein